MPSVLNPEALEEEDLAMVDEKWDSLLRDHFSTSAPNASAPFEDVFEERPSDFLWDQVATHLESLGYLGDLDQEGVRTAPALQRAFESWRLDFESEEGEGVRVDLGDDEQLSKLSELERSIRLLKAQCSFEGETTLDPAKLSNKQSLAARIALHRLRCFGLLSFDEDLDSLEREKADSLIVSLTRRNDPHIALVNVLGDLPELTSRFVQTQHKRVFAFAKEDVTATDLMQSHRVERERRFGLGQRSFRERNHLRNQHRRAARDDSQPNSDRNLSNLLEPGLRRKRNTSELVPGPALRQFSLYLLQVRLWTYGYYTGALDGRWGLMLANALDRFVEDHESHEKGNLARGKRRKWMRGGEDSRVIDLAYFFSFMVSRLDEAAEATAREEIDEIVTNALGSDSQEGNTQEEIQDAERTLTEEIAKAHLERREGLANDRLRSAAPGQARKPRRRRYFGWRSVFSFMGRAIGWVGRSIKKALKWIKEKIRTLKHYATILLNYIREKTRRAVLLASLGIQRLKLWITGDPVGTKRGSSFLVSRFQRDFDTVNFSSGPVNSELVQDHITRIDALNAGFGFLVEVGLSVWSVVSALRYAFVNWLLIAWRAYRAVKRALAYIDENEHLLEKLEPAVL